MNSDSHRASAPVLSLRAYDSAIQSLYGICLRLEYCLDVMDESPEQAKDALQAIVEHIDEEIDVLRSRIYDLYWHTESEDMTNAQLRVMLVDDHEVVREGLRALLNRRPGMTVVGEAGSVAQAIEVAAKEKPDVVVMDVRLPDGTGVEACRDIRASRPETRLIMLTSYADEEAVLASILAGASAYLLKQTRGQQLAEAIEAVGRGESLLDPQVTMRVLDQVRSMANGSADKNAAQLNENENKILALIAEGKTNKEIATEIYLSDKTVKNYVSSILSKLNLRRRSEAAAYSARRTSGRPD